MTSDAADRTDQSPPTAPQAQDLLSRFLRAALSIAAAGALLAIARVAGLVAMFACGEPASPIPFCTGTTPITSGWGTADNSPLWTPGLLTVAGMALGLALWQLVALRRRHRPAGYLVTGVLVAHVAGAITVVNL